MTIFGYAAWLNGIVCKNIYKYNTIWVIYCFIFLLLIYIIMLKTGLISELYKSKIDTFAHVLGCLYYYGRIKVGNIGFIGPKLW